MQDYLDSVQKNNTEYIHSEMQGINIQLDDITSQVHTMCSNV